MKTYRLIDNAIQFFNHILAKENRKYLLLDIVHLRALSKLEFHRGLFLDLFSSVFI